MLNTLFLTPTLTTGIEHALGNFIAASGERAIKPVTFLVPSAGTILSIRRRLGNTMGVRLFQFYGLGQAVLDASNLEIHQISETAAHRLVYALIAQMHRQGNLSTFEPVWDKPGFNQVLVEWLREMKSQGITPEQVLIHQMAGDPERDRQLGQLYSNYQSFLHEHGLSDASGLLWLAAEALEAEPCLFSSLGSLVVLGFDQFTPVQLRILKSLTGRSSAFTVYLPWDSSRRAGSLALARLEDTRRFLEASFQFKVETLEDNHHEPRSLFYLRRALFEPSMPAMDGQVQAVKMVAAPSREAEVRQALKDIKQLVLQGVLADEIAILSPAPSVYARMVETAAEEYGVPIQIERRLAANPAVAALLNLLALSPDFSWRSTLDALRSPYVQQNWLTLSQIDTLERISRNKAVVAGMEQWEHALRPVVLSPEDESLIEELDQDDDGAPASHQPGHFTAIEQKSIFDGLMAFFNHLTPPPVDTHRGYTLWLQEAILGIFSDDDEGSEIDLTGISSLQMLECIRQSPFAERDLEALRSILAALRRLVEAAELAAPLEGELISWEAYRGEVVNALLSLSMPFDVSVSGIRFDALSTGRWQPVNYLFVLGLSEGEFPSRPAPDLFYSQSERLQHPLPLVRQAPAEEASLWWQVISGCRRELTLIRPRLDEKGVPWLASPFWDAVLDKLPGIEIVEPPVAAMPEPGTEACLHELLAGLASRPETFQLTRVEIPREGALAWSNMLAAYQVLNARQSWQATPSYEGILQGDRVRKQIRKAFPPDYPWSASQLGSYAACPFRFFSLYLLRLDALPEPQEGLDLLQRGHLLHSVLELLHRRLGEAGLAPCAEDREQVLEELDRCCDQVFADASESIGFRPGPLWRYEQQELRRLLAAFVDWECQENGQAASYLPYQQELRFGFAGSSKSDLRIRVGEGKYFRLRGVIDRIDRRRDGGLRVIDYKSGKTPYKKEHAERGLALQAPLYALAAESMFPGAQVVEAGYLLVAGRKLCGGDQLAGGAAEDNWVRSAVEAAFTFIEQARYGQFPAAPVKQPSDRLPCEMPCEFRDFCRIDRHSLAKSRRWNTGRL
jgi:ATP-dependent helicase/nuclease subunit B